MTGCYRSLLTGEAAEKSVPALLVDELSAAAKTGVVAALVVAVALFSFASRPAAELLAVVAPRAAGAFVFAVALHLLVLLAGIALVRLHERVILSREENASL